MTIAVITEGAVPVAHRAAPRGLWARRAQRREEQLAQAEAMRLVRAWVATAYGAGLGADTSSAAGIPGTSVPQVVSVNLDEPVRLIVRLRPAQVVADLLRVADRLAEGLSVPRVRITPRSHGYARVELLRADPLADSGTWLGQVASVHEPIQVGRTEQGADLRVPLLEAGHAIVQGRTRSGKSLWSYSWLAQLAQADDVIVSGSDPSGLLLAPWEARQPSWVALGTSGGAQAHLDVLDALTAEMDRRLRTLPKGCDKLPISSSDPALLVALEEYPALIRLASTAGKPAAGQPKVVERIQGQVGRLLSEGAKVGVCVLLIAQRADAAIVGGFERGQASLRLSFSVDSGDALKMLHSGVDAPTAEAHATAPKGVALLSAPELPLLRIRGPYLPGEYAAYCQLVAGQNS
jgi:hypothetical protein